MSRLQPIRARLYAVFIEPRQTDPTLRNREFVFNVVLAGTGLCMAALALLLLQSYLSGNGHVLGRLVVPLVGVGFAAGLLRLSRRGHYKLSAHLLVGFYFLLAAGSVAAWGIGTPFGVLLLGLVIVMAGTILAPRLALYVSGAASVTVIAVQIATQAGLSAETSASLPAKGELGDAIGHSVVFAILGAISWLFAREVERSLDRAELAEAALEGEKATLEVRVAKRTAELKKVQIEEMQQLYHFAEVGQLSTALLHDLANHLAVLTLEIEGVQSKRHAEQLARSRLIIGQLNAMIDVVRDRLTLGPTNRRYNLLDIIDDVIDFSLLKDPARSIRIVWQRPGDNQQFQVVGDPVKWSQIVAILLGNAIDAYASQSGTPGKLPTIAIKAVVTENGLRFSVIDWSVGINKAARKKIFRPNYTTKRSGMGIGLYLARQMTTSELSGRLSLSPRTDCTEFVVTLPRIDGDSAG